MVSSGRRRASPPSASWGGEERERRRPPSRKVWQVASRLDVTRCRVQQRRARCGTRVPHSLLCPGDSRSNKGGDVKQAMCGEGGYGVEGPWVQWRGGACAGAIEGLPPWRVLLLVLFLDPLLFIHKGRTEGTKFSSFKGWTHKGGGFSFRVHLLSSAFGGDWDVRRISG